jgi:hypothetical protein
MSRLSLRRHHDPFWEVDGPAARREYRQRRLVSWLAFAAAVTAVVATAFAWSIELGVVAGVGTRVPLLLG